MPQQVALFICILFILWLLARDQELRPLTSWGLWVPLTWIIIIGSRYISFWLNGIERESLTPDDLLAGSPLDRNVFLVLMIMGAVVLIRRRPDWHRILKSNPWFFVFFIYCGISIIWSDYPFVSFKRWSKELGNVIMVLIILTEGDPVKAARAVLARYTYFAIALSVFFINFFPQIGVYNFESGELAYCGVAIDKNMLGIIIFICGLFLVWDLIHMRSADERRTDAADIFGRGVLLLMAAWLIYIANSKTALVCLILGTGILLLMKIPFVRQQIKHLGIYSLVLGSLVLLLYSGPSILGEFVQILGRDTTFTGRTDIWADVLSERINPLLGTGYQSFWLGSRADYFWGKYSVLNQAHNGYLEVYLNGGLIGLCLLFGIILSTGSKLKNEILLGNSFAILLFTFVVTGLFYNLTEARFGGLNLLWVILSVAALYHSPLHES